MAHTFEEYESALEHRKVVNIVYVASAMLLVYDLLLTLHLEITLVWLSRWNYTKVLYLLVRYIPFVANVMILYNQLVPGASGSTCANVFKTAGWLYFVGLDLAQAILVIRTWACWGRNRWVGICLAFWMLPGQIPAGVFMYKFLDSLKFGSPYTVPGSNACFVTGSNRLLWGDWLVFLTGEGVALILMIIFAYQSSRDGNDTPLVKLIYTDGLAFYVYLFCVTSINIALTLTLDDGFVAMVSPVQSAIHSVLTARVVLNIREAASRRLDDHSFDIHLSNTDIQARVSQVSLVGNLGPIRFADIHVSDDTQHRERLGSVVTTRTEMVSVSNSTEASHITLPMTRDAEGKRVVGRSEPDEDDDDDDDKDSIRTFLDEWV